MPGPYQPDRQGMNTLSLTHKGLQMTPRVEPPLHVCAVGQLGIGCVSQHQTLLAAAQMWRK